MKRKDRFKERDGYLDYINSCALESPEEVEKLFVAVTKVIWDYRLIGKIYDFYGDNVTIYREGGNDMVGVQDVVNDTLAHISAIPDLKFHFLGIHCEGNKKDGYYFGQAVEFEGTNLGHSKYGKPTGKSLLRNGHGTLDLCEVFVKKADGRFRVHTEWGARSEKANAEVLGAGEVRGTMAQNSGEWADQSRSSGNQSPGRTLQSDIHSDRIKELEKIIESVEIKTAEDVKTFFRAYTELVWDFKMAGRIDEFCTDDLYVDLGNWNLLNGRDAYVTHCLEFMAMFPDLKVTMDNIIVTGNAKDGFNVFRRMRFAGSNIGVNSRGPSTGKSLGDNCLCLSYVNFSQMNGEWLMTHVREINSENLLDEVLTL